MNSLLACLRLYVRQITGQESEVLPILKSLSLFHDAGLVFLHPLLQMLKYTKSADIKYNRVKAIVLGDEMLLVLRLELFDQGQG